MHIKFYTQDGDSKELSADSIEEALQSQQGAVWIDIAEPTIERIALLDRLFNFHPLAIEDIQNQEQRPKAEEFSDHIFLILNPVVIHHGDLLSHELGIFVGANYVVTVHAKPDPIIAEAQGRIDPNRVPFPISATYLLYVIIDTVVDAYLPLLEDIDTQIDNIGQSLLTSPDPQMQNQLFNLKQSLNMLWWIVWPQFDILNVLTKHELVFIDDKSKHYLRDIEDHLRRITDMIQISRDGVNGLINLYVSAVSNQLNVAVNRLTIFTIIIGMLAVISGFYGMNFEQTWPPFDAPWGVPFILLSMIILTLVIYRVLQKPR